MSEITINKNNKSITFTHNNIAFSQFGVADEILDLITDLQNKLQQKENIIKEVREFAKLRKEMYERQENVVGQEVIISLLGIVDKGDEK